MAAVTVYRWKPGTVCSVDADRAGRALDGILERHGRLTPELVVEESRPEDAPLHPEFEWDDRVAAENWRREQASYLIRHIAVVIPNRKEQTLVRAFVSVAEEADGEHDDIGTAVKVLARSSYVRTMDALATPNLRRQVLERALRELDSWQRRYSDLEELARVFESATAVRAQLELQPVT